MNKREYLRSQGFRVGERGRFTDEMKIALAKYDGVFEEDIKPLDMSKLKNFGGTPKKKAKKVNEHNQEQIRGRDARILYGKTIDGTKVGFVSCSKCHEHMIFCSCPEGIHAPSVVHTTSDTLVYVPKV